jgi:hypothetical protein
MTNRDNALANTGGYRLLYDRRAIRGIMNTRIQFMKKAENRTVPVGNHNLLIGTLRMKKGEGK